MARFFITRRLFFYQQGTDHFLLGMSAAKFWPLSNARQTLKPIYSCSMYNVSITFPKIRRKFPWETSPGKLPMKDC
jgi:hypothetical protein